MELLCNKTCAKGRLHFGMVRDREKGRERGKERVREKASQVQRDRERKIDTERK